MRALIPVTNGSYRNTNVAHSRKALRLFCRHVGSDIFGRKTGNIFLCLAQTVKFAQVSLTATARKLPGFSLQNTHASCAAPGAAEDLLKLRREAKGTTAARKSRIAVTGRELSVTKRQLSHLAELSTLMLRFCPQLGSCRLYRGGQVVARKLFFLPPRGTSPAVPGLTCSATIRDFALQKCLPSLAFSLCASKRLQSLNYDRHAIKRVILQL